MSQALGRMIAIAATAALSISGTAQADSGGGAAFPAAPQVEGVRCVSTADKACAGKRSAVRGGTIKIAGANLNAVKRIVFRGRRTRSDDVSTRPEHRNARHLEAIVPSSARSGPLSVIDEAGQEATTKRSVAVVAPPPIDVAPGSGFYFAGRRKPTVTFTVSDAGPVEIQVVRSPDRRRVTSFAVDAKAGTNTAAWNGRARGKAAPSGEYIFRVAGASGAQAGPSKAFALFDHLFPIRGKHNLGYTYTNQFGGGRGHQGLDMFAKCGTRLAVARGGKVQFAGYHSAAGNYAVIDGAGTGTDYVYMHMREPALVRTGQRVFTGQKLGLVGDTGRATGCHLHFEMWASPGWYQGGSPFDPLPSLKRWDSYR